MPSIGGSLHADQTDPNVPVDLDDLTDEQVMERCRRARAAEREMACVRGLAIMGARNWNANLKLYAGVAIFHPGREEDIWKIR